MPQHEPSRCQQLTTTNETWAYAAEPLELQTTITICTSLRLLYHLRHTTLYRCSHSKHNYYSAEFPPGVLGEKHKTRSFLIIFDHSEFDEGPEALKGPNIFFSEILPESRSDVMHPTSARL